MTASNNTVPSYQRKWRNLLLDTRFQLKFTGYAVLATAVVAVLLGGFIWNMSTALLREAESAVQARSQAAQTSHDLNMATLNMELLRRFEDPRFTAELKSRSLLLDQQFRDEKREIEAQRATLLDQQRAMSMALILGFTVLLILIALGFIVATHRVAGPIYRARRMVKDMAHGKSIPPVRLRRGDEFKEFIDELGGLALTLSEERAQWLQRIEQAIHLAETSHASTELKDELLALRRKLASTPSGETRDAIQG